MENVGKPQSFILVKWFYTGIASEHKCNSIRTYKVFKKYQWEHHLVAGFGDFWDPSWAIFLKSWRSGDIKYDTVRRCCGAGGIWGQISALMSQKLFTHFWRTFGTFLSRKQFTHSVWKVFAREILPTGKFWLFVFLVKATTKVAFSIFGTHTTYKWAALSNLFQIWECFWSLWCLKYHRFLASPDAQEVMWFCLSVCLSLTLGLLTWLMWPWWVMIPLEDLVRGSPMIT